MPDHVHGLIPKHKHIAKEVMQNLYSEIRLRLRDLNDRGLQHRVLGGTGWKVFLDTPDDIWRTIRYIEENPEKIGRPKQVYDVVTPYNNWPFHKGSNPISLREAVERGIILLTAKPQAAENTGLARISPEHRNKRTPHSFVAM
jgi:hypothetical protein